MFYDTPLVMVEDQQTLAEVVEHLRTCPVIGVDTEADSFHHYKEKLCLIQVSDQERDYIIDPLKVPDISPFAALLEDEAMVKVLHGGDYDVVSLKRDYGIHIHNIFDTMIAGQFLGFPRIGLADLIRRFFGYEIDKKYQRHDWARRPLEEEHLDYARGDTHFLLALRDVLQLRLQRAGRLDAHIEECKLLEDREWGGRGGGAADFLRVKKSNALDETGKRVLRAVWTYRDEQARQADRPSFKILPDHVLLALSHDRPTNAEDFARIMRPGASMTRLHGEALFAAVAEGLADKRPLPTGKEKDDDDKRSRNRPERSREDAPGVDLLLAALKQWRNDVVDRESLAPVVVASNGLLKEISVLAPRDLDELRAVPGVRKWQVEHYGEELLAALHTVEERTPKRKRPRRRRRKSDGE